MSDDELAVAQLPIDDLMALKRDADLYRRLRAMHWTDGGLCVIASKFAPLGVQTYTGERLDEAIRQLKEPG